MLVVEPVPLAKVFDLFVHVLALRDDALDGLVRLELLLLALLVEEQHLVVFAREVRRREPFLVRLVRLDVVVDALEAFEALEELVHLVGVVEMGEVLPFNVETL